MLTSDVRLLIMEKLLKLDGRLTEMKSEKMNVFKEVNNR